MSKSTAASINAINAAARVKSTPKVTAPAPKAAKPAAPAAKTKVAKATQTVTPADESDRDETSYAEQFAAMFGEFKIPSGKRMLCSVVVQAFVLGSGIYSGIQVGALLAFGAAMLTGSAFLAFIGWFVVVAISIYGALIAAARVGRYIALGEIDNDISTAKAWLGSKFTSIKARFTSKDEAAHA